MSDLAVDSLWQVFREAESPRVAARALWVLSAINSSRAAALKRAAEHPNADLRIVAIRAALQQDVDVIPIASQLASDASPRVRREVAIALHNQASEQVPEIWAELALRHDGQDRWYLEALGIGAAGQWDRIYPVWRSRVDGDVNDPAFRDIV